MSKHIHYNDCFTCGFSVHVPRPLLRGNEDSRGGVPAAGNRGGQERDGGVVRAGSVDMSGGPGVHGRVGLLSHVLQAHAARHGVHGTVPELGGDTAAAGEGVQDEPMSVHRQIGGRVSAQQGAHGAAVLQRWRRGQQQVVIVVAPGQRRRQQQVRRGP